MAEEHTTHELSRHQARRIQWDAEGLCTFCGNARDLPGRKHCARCSNYALTARQRRKAAGVCRCNRAIETVGQKKCDGCRLRESRRKASYTASGLCRCGRNTPLTGLKWCQQCKDADTALQVRQSQSRKAAGLCVECGVVPARLRRKTCASCGVRQTRATQRWIRRHPDRATAMWQANRFRREQRLLHSGGNFTGAQWSALKKAQAYRCLCCGRRHPEIRLTVDHVIPVVKGGTNDISNIQGLCLECNLDKHVQTTDYRAAGLPDS